MKGNRTNRVQRRQIKWFLLLLTRDWKKKECSFIRSSIGRLRLAPKICVEMFLCITRPDNWLQLLLDNLSLWICHLFDTKIHFRHQVLFWWYGEFVSLLPSKVSSQFGYFQLSKWSVKCKLHSIENICTNSHMNMNMNMNIRLQLPCEWESPTRPRVIRKENPFHTIFRRQTTKCGWLQLAATRRKENSKVLNGSKNWGKQICTECGICWDEMDFIGPDGENEKQL